MKINLNTQITVHLTDNGKKIYQRCYDCNDEDIPVVLTTELWNFASIFGLHLYAGNVDAPFTVDNEIELVDKYPNLPVGVIIDDIHAPGYTKVRWLDGIPPYGTKLFLKP